MWVVGFQRAGTFLERRDGADLDGGGEGVGHDVHFDRRLSHTFEKVKVDLVVTDTLASDRQ